MADSPKRPVDDRLVQLWLALGLIFALFVATGAGVLGWLGGETPPLAILTGGGAFGGTVMLVIFVINLLRR